MNAILDNLQPYQLQIIESLFACERVQFRFPRSKKKRIKKKWSKRNENYKEIPKMYQMGNKLIAHPTLIEQFKKDIQFKYP